MLERLTERIGNTPLVRLHRTARRYGALAEVLLKLEYLNPLGSVKDRTAQKLLEDALAAGRVGPDSVLIEPTTGNTGIGLAFAAAAAGIRLILVMPERVSAERIRLAKLLGARVVLTPAAAALRGCIARAEALQRSIPSAVILQQFRNPANPAIHERTTGPEIWRDSDGQLDVVVAGVGTGGTRMGVARALKPLHPGRRRVAVQPARSPVPRGGEAVPHQRVGMGPNVVSPLVDRSLIDEILSAHEEDAHEVLRTCASLDGIRLGVSSGAVAWAALQLARRPDQAGRRIVANCASGRERGLSSSLLTSIHLESDEVKDWFGAEPRWRPTSQDAPADRHGQRRRGCPAKDCGRTGTGAAAVPAHGGRCSHGHRLGNRCQWRSAAGGPPAGQASPSAASDGGARDTRGAAGPPEPSNGRKTLIPRIGWSQPP